MGSLLLVPSAQMFLRDPASTWVKESSPRSPVIFTVRKGGSLAWATPGRVIAITTDNPKAAYRRTMHLFLEEGIKKYHGPRTGGTGKFRRRHLRARRRG